MYGLNNRVVCGRGFNVGNPDIKWEVANTFNIGADAGLFNNRLNFTFDYFNKLTKNIILQPNLPGTYGGGSVDYNIASVRIIGRMVSASYNFHYWAQYHSIGHTFVITDN